jgi:membrane protein YdbS with pleckstrin-like domain
VVVMTVVITVVVVLVKVAFCPVCNRKKIWQFHTSEKDFYVSMVVLREEFAMCAFSFYVDIP